MFYAENIELHFVSNEKAYTIQYSIPNWKLTHVSKPPHIWENCLNCQILSKSSVVHFTHIVLVNYELLLHSDLTIKLLLHVMLFPGLLLDQRYDSSYPVEVDTQCFLAACFGSTWPPLVTWPSLTSLFITLFLTPRAVSSQAVIVLSRGFHTLWSFSR